MSESAIYPGDPGPLQHFREALDAGRFELQQCRDCGQHVFYPRECCNHCGSADLKWVPASGHGEVCSTRVVRQAPEQGGDYNVSIIRLDEGPQMVSRVVDVLPEEVKTGTRVTAHIGLVDGQPAVLFTTGEGVNEW